MNLFEVFKYYQTLEVTNLELSEELEMLKTKQLNAEKFYNVALTTEMVGKLHDVSPALVRKYTDLGYIDKHPKSSKNKILIRGSDALLLDFKKFKKEEFNNNH